MELFAFLGAFLKKTDYSWNPISSAECSIQIITYYSKTCLVLAQPRKTRPCLAERLLMGHRESN